MRIFFNITNDSSYGGLQVALSILRQWSTKFDVQLILCTLEEHKIFDSLDDDLKQHLLIEKIPYRMAAVKTRRAMQKLSDKLVRKHQPDIVFTPFGPSYWTPEVPHLIGFALGQIVYPDSPVIFKMSFRQRLKYFLEFLCYKKYYFKHNSRFFWCETEDVKERMTRYLRIRPEQIVVAGNCCDQLFYDFVGERKNDGFFNILCPCSGNLHKNLEIIGPVLEILKELPIRFTVTLPDIDYLRLFGENNPRVINLGVLPPEKCPSAYVQSDMIFVPSLLECFTANYPEAMAMNKPIVATDLSFARDLCGGAALYYAPLSAEKAAEKIAGLYHDHELYSKIVAAGQKELKKFPSPGQRAEEIFKFMQYIMNNN